MALQRSDQPKRVRDYLAAKPRGKFGKHQYEMADARAETMRDCAADVQRGIRAYFAIPNEI